MLTSLEHVQIPVVQMDRAISLYQDDGFAWVLKFYDSEGNLWGVLQFNPPYENKETVI